MIVANSCVYVLLLSESIFQIVFGYVNALFPVIPSYFREQPGFRSLSDDGFQK